jgi:hypothetical protein
LQVGDDLRRLTYIYFKEHIMSKKAICAALLLSATLAALTACGSVSSVSPGTPSNTTGHAAHPLDQSPNQPYK